MTHCLSFEVELSIRYLKAAGKRFQASHWASASKTSLNSQQRCFLEFARRFEIYSFDDIDGEVLIVYALWLIATRRITSVDTVKNYLSGVRTLCLMYGQECPTPVSYPPLDWTLHGLRRELQTPSRRKLPVTTDILFNLLTSPASMENPPPSVSWELQVFFTTVQVFYLVSFFSMLRCSNLLPKSHASADPLRQLVWSRIRRVEGGVVFRVVYAKNLQFGDIIHEVSLPERPGSMFCPVAALTLLARLNVGIPCLAGDFVFSVPKDGQMVHLLKDPVVKIFRQQLGRMGLDPSKYGFHSFRHGGIQAAVRCQPSLELVRLQSGHRSNAIHVYTAMPGASRMVTGAKMLAELSGELPISLSQTPPHSPRT
jgi:hypothetical protein